MSISSVGNTLSSLLVSAYGSSALSSAKTSDDSSESSTKALTGVVATNSDGDTFQLSEAAQSTQLSASEMYSKMDADGDGSVSEEEFVATRPEDVTEGMASNLYNSIDSDSSGAVTESEFETAMNSAPPPPPSATTGSSDSSTESESFSELDTNQDGMVSAEELAAARPEDVTEKMAANLFKSLDTDGSGGLTEAEYTAAMGNTASVSGV